MLSPFLEFLSHVIGELNEDGSISLIDRKKNLVKLSNGEYIALEKLESIYKSNQYVTNICVYGDSDRDSPAAIVMCIPNVKRQIEFSSSVGKYPV